MLQLLWMLAEPAKRNISEEVFELRDKKDSTVVIGGGKVTDSRLLPVALVTMKEEDTYVSKRQVMRDIFAKYLKFIGPRLMVSVAYIDPGNYSTAVDAGASNQFSLLCIILLSNFIAIFLQCLCIKLGSVTGLDLREFPGVFYHGGSTGHCISLQNVPL